MTYEMQPWEVYALGGGCGAAALFLILWLAQIVAYRHAVRDLEKERDVVKWAKETAIHMEREYQLSLAERDKAKAEAREATAAHQECARKLALEEAAHKLTRDRAEEAEKSADRACEAQLNLLRQKLRLEGELKRLSAKKPPKPVKKAKSGPKKKVKKSVAKRKPEH